MTDGGKGSNRRPTDDAAYAEGWERIWGVSRREVPASGGLVPELPGTGVDQVRQVADSAVPVNGPVNVPVLDADALAGANLA